MENKKRVPDLLIEQLLMGELPDARSRELLRDPEVQERLRLLEESNRTILEAYPAEVMAKRIGWRLEKAVESRPVRTPLARLLPMAGFAALMVVAGLAVVMALTWARRPVQTLEVTRVKGLEPHLAVYRQTGSGAEALASNGTVHPGDVLQIGYVAGSRTFGMIFSIDGRGVVTLHFPSSGSVPSRLTGDGEVLLDYAYKLDDAPEFERFFLVTGAQAFPMQAVLQSAQALAAHPQRARTGSLALPRGLEQWSVLLLKK
jgi:hypothetical protein